jgi:prepilin-type N-terminal cleavage/methylation domain-containing protein
MTQRGRTSGFTLIELLIAIVMLSIGLLAVAGGAIYTTKDLQRSKLSTIASGLTTGKLDQLLVYANRTQTRCTSSLFASSSAPVVTNKVSLTWTVPSSGVLRTVLIIASYKLARGVTKVDTLTARVAC